eukprot:403333301
MYKNSYQYGRYVPLFNVQNKESINNWVFQGSVKKAYDKSCKSFVFVFDHATKAQMPDDSRQKELYLVQPFILLQLMITDKKLFNLEVTVTDQQKIKRRLIFTTGSSYSYSKDNIIKQPLHARIPFGDMLKEGVWLNLQFDIQSFVDTCFGQINFRSIDAIQISGACRLRKIMTMKGQVVDHTAHMLEREYGPEIAQEYEQQFGGVDYQAEELQGNMNFTSGVEYMNQVISFDKIIFWGYLMENVINVGNGSDEKKFRQKPNIAFGSRITEKPIIEEQQKVKNAMGMPKLMQKLSQGQLYSSPQRALQGAHNEGIIYTQTSSPSQQHRSVIRSNNISKSGGIYEQTSAIRQYQRGGTLLKHNQMRQTEVSQGEFQITQSVAGDLRHRSTGRQSNNNEDIRDTGVDFSQYKVGTTTVNTRNGVSIGVRDEYSNSPKKSTIMSHVKSNGSLRKLGNGGQMQCDDYYINEKLKYLQAQRLVIHQLAAKYNLENNPKIEQLSLIKTVIGGPNGHHGHHDQASYLGQDPKERIKEYHNQVNAKRRQIHQKKLEKIKNMTEEEKEAMELKNNAKKGIKKNRIIKQVAADGQDMDKTKDEEDDQGDEEQEDDETKRQKRQERVESKLQENANGAVDGWDGDAAKDDDYGNEDDYGEEKANDDVIDKNEGGDDYGDEAGDDGDVGGKDDDYGDEQKDEEEDAPAEEDGGEEYGNEDNNGDDY